MLRVIDKMPQSRRDNALPCV